MGLSAIVIGGLALSAFFSDYWPDLATELQAEGKADFIQIENLQNDDWSETLGGAERVLPSVSYDSDGVFSFLTLDSKNQGTGFLNPCQTVEYKVNPINEPQGARQMIHTAFARLSEATGISFVDAGETSETIKPWSESDQDYFDYVLINYVSADKMREHAEAADWDEIEDVVGLAGPSWGNWLDPVEGTYYSSGGTVLLDYEYILSDLAGEIYGYPIGDPTLNVILHELGHVAGLGHVDDESELMAPYYSGPPLYQDGDLEGLAIAGSGPCAASTITGEPIFGSEPEN